nr:aspartyl protease family protein At5g10770-like [Ipomoea batatas]
MGVNGTVSRHARFKQFSCQSRSRLSTTPNIDLVDHNRGLSDDQTECQVWRRAIASEAHYTLFHSVPCFPFSSANPTTSKGLGRKASMKVAHRFGPCSGRGGDSPTMREILLRDESRVQSIQARVRSLSLANNNMGESETVDLPAANDMPSGGGNYFVTVGLGTPAKDVELAFDTGSDLTWAQCQPCAAACYNQILPIFDPAASTTYSNLTCTSEACSQLEAATYYPGQCEENSTTCSYVTSYDDSSYSVGQLATDKLTLNSTDGVVEGFIFGCGQNNNFTYDVGLQRSARCFQAADENVSFTTKTPHHRLLDTCYNFTNYPNPTIPEISFTFGGNLEVHLDPRGVMLPLYPNRSQVCLAFANYTDGGIFGNYQQQTFEVVYDVAGGQLGFASGGCS